MKIIPFTGDGPVDITSICTIGSTYFGAKVWVKTPRNTAVPCTSVNSFAVVDCCTRRLASRTKNILVNYLEFKRIMAHLIHFGHTNDIKIAFKVVHRITSRTSKGQRARELCIAEAFLIRLFNPLL